jgi:stress-induced morphogen
MAVTIELLNSLIKEKLNATHVETIDTSDGCGQSFECIIVSNAFEGKSVLQKHRMVNEALKDQIKEIHAFSQVFII